MGRHSWLLKVGKRGWSTPPCHVRQVSLHRGQELLALESRAERDWNTPLSPPCHVRQVSLHRGQKLLALDNKAERGWSSVVLGMAAGRAVGGCARATRVLRSLRCDYAVTIRLLYGY